MSYYYYLSSFVGSGNHNDPFRAVAADCGPASILDLRRDATRRDGWCFVCVERENPIDTATTTGLIYLGDDPHAKLDNGTINKLKDRLAVDFKSENLAEIVAEILLLQRIPGRGLRAGLDGTYSFHLGKLVWKVTETEAYEFVGKLRETELLGQPAPRPGQRIADLRPRLDHALITIADVVNHDRSGWLDKEIEKVKRKQSNHPVAINYFEATKVREHEDFTRLHNSAAVIWMLMLAGDIVVCEPQLDIARLSSRLRDARDCEPTKYELYIMAGYIHTGVRVEKTDKDSTGEFRVFSGDRYVHVECKYKSLESMRARRVKPVFDIANEQLRELLEGKNRKILLQITCRTDPIEDDLRELLDSISRALETEAADDTFQFKCGGKYDITVLPSARISDGSQLRLPAGFEYGFTEATMEKGCSGDLAPCHGWGIVWNVLRPGGWIRSVVESVRQAASQLPPESPNLIYIHVPTGSVGAVETRIDSARPEIETLLSNPERYTRVNAVILTGQATLYGWSAPDVATVRFIYKTILNQNPRNAQPVNFRIFGRDFTRK
ncbi:MAG TPA: hypothetical protein VKN18_30540 [Blastocatellia bacterium]|nr:hypothetical protein [Blastocatellia bacterium]